jgi:hypothetical protein
MDAAILAGLAGLLGILLGRVWDQKSESSRWRRDRRVQSYQEVASDFYQYRNVIRRVAGAPRGTPEFEDLSARLYNGHAVWNQRLSALWLHGAGKVTLAAYELDHALAQLGEEAMNMGIGADEWPVRKGPAHEKFDDFIDAVRSDLKLSVLGVLRERAIDRTA